MPAETMPPPPLFPESTERQPPYAPEAEISVLGGCLIDPDAYPKAVEIVDDAMFYREGHRRIFRSLGRIFQRGEVVDPTTLAEDLSRAGELEQAGGFPYLGELMEAVPTAANIEWHARIVRERAQLRALIDAGTALVQDAFNPGERSVDEILGAAERRVLELGAGDAKGDDPLQWMKKILYPTFEEIEKRQGSPGGITGVASGLPDLDDMTGGFQKGELTIIAARPGMGKTALVTTMLAHAVVTAAIRSLLFSLEMSKGQLVQRMLCSEALVDLSRLLRGRLTDDDYVRLAQAAGHFNTAPLWIDDRGALTNTEIRAAARRNRAKEGPVGLIVVDYLQLMQTSGRRENRQQEVTEISGGLKALAKDMDCPVIALSQLSRAPENRSDHRPQLSDLRESGAIEQDADLVMFLYRPDYYLSDAETREQGVAGKAELIISKHRNGPTGSVDLFFRKESTRFEPYAGIDGRRPGF